LIAHFGSDDPRSATPEPLLERSKHFGRLDDVRVYNRLVTAGEVAAIYQQK